MEYSPNFINGEPDTLHSELDIKPVIDNINEDVKPNIADIVWQPIDEIETKPILEKNVANVKIEYRAPVPSPPKPPPKIVFKCSNCSIIFEKDGVVKTKLDPITDKLDLIWLCQTCHHSSGNQEKPTSDQELESDDEEDIDDGSKDEIADEIIKKDLQQKCKICNREVDWKTIIEHTLNHGNDKETIRCCICLKLFPKSRNDFKLTLERHMRIHMPLECGVCHQQFPTRSEHKKHVDEKHIIQNIQTINKFTCKFCLKSIKSTELKVHSLSHKRIGPNKNHKKKNNKNTFPCCICLSSSFRNSEHLLRHLDIHERKPFNCTTCQSFFINQEDLNDHYRTRHPDSHLYKCPHCQDTCCGEPTFMTHLRIYHQLEYKCQVCQHRFIGQTNLNVHMKQHAKESEKVSQTNLKPRTKEIEKVCQEINGEETRNRVSLSRFDKFLNYDNVRALTSRRKSRSESVFVEQNKTQEKGNQDIKEEVPQKKRERISIKDRKLMEENLIATSPRKSRLENVFVENNKSPPKSESSKTPQRSEPNKSQENQQTVEVKNPDPKLNITNQVPTEYQKPVKPFKQKFDCNVCKKRYAESRGVRVHYARLHATENANSIPFDANLHMVKHYECKTCLRLYGTFEHFLKHYKRQHQQKPRITPTLKFVDTNDVKIPVQNKLNKQKSRNDKSKSCLFCDIKSKTFEDWNEHMCKNHPESYSEGNYLCYYCQQKYSAVLALRHHVRRSHARFHYDIPEYKIFLAKLNQNSTYKCDKCPKQFASPWSLRSHLKTCSFDQDVGKSLKNLDNFKICKFCDVKSKTFEAWNKHMCEIHSESYSEKNILCYYCERRYSAVLTLRMHVRVVHSDQFEYQQFLVNLNESASYKCEKCERQCQSPWHLQYHLKNCSGNQDGLKKIVGNRDGLKKIVGKKLKVHGTYKSCKFCDIKLKTFDDWNEHLKENHPESHSEGNYQCYYCDKKTFATIIALEQHARRSHGDKIGYKQFVYTLLHNSRSYNCKNCQKQYLSPWSLKSHANNCRGKQPNKIPNISKIKNISKVKINFKIEDGIKIRSKFKSCKFCDVKLRTYEEWNEHMSQTHPESFSKGAYLCYYCDKIYTTILGLIIHARRSHATKLVYRNFLRTLSGSVKLYDCHKCQKEFASPWTLSTHINNCNEIQPKVTQHTEIQPEHTKTDSKLEHNVTKHTRDDSEIDLRDILKKFLCKFCGSKYQTKYSLARHLKEKHQGVSIVCKFCGLEYQTKYSLIRHMRNKHKCLSSEINAILNPAENLVKEITKNNCKVVLVKTENIETMQIETSNDLSNEISNANEKPSTSYTPLSKQVKIEAISNCSTPSSASSSNDKEPPATYVSVMGVDCTICKEVFASNSQLLSHILTHGNIQFLCHICNDIFSEPTTLQDHLLNHNTINTINNQESTPNFKEYTDLVTDSDEDCSILEPSKICIFCKDHVAPKSLTVCLCLKILKPDNFECDSCSLEFKGQWEFTSHLKLYHEDFKGYKCRFCNISYSNLEKLTTHVREIHTRNYFKCNVCYKIFDGNNSDLKFYTHMKTCQ